MSDKTDRWLEALLCGDFDDDEMPIKFGLLRQLIVRVIAAKQVHRSPGTRSAANALACEIVRQLSAGEMPCQPLCSETAERCRRCLQWRYRVAVAEGAIIAAEKRGAVQL